MRLFRTFLPAALAAGLIATPAVADPPRDAERAFRGTTEGRVMSLPQIKRRVMPLVGNDVAVDLGPEIRGDTYRLKFIMKDGRVVWVDVDPRTGEVVRRSR